MNDPISRQAAIDALKVAYWNNDIQSAKDDPCIVDAMTDWAIRQIKALPSSQQEIIRCEDCKHWGMHKSLNVPRKMNDLISRQAALDIIDAELSGWLTDDERLHLEGVGTGIECLPTIDPVKRGKWIPINERAAKCSLCGEWEYTNGIDNTGTAIIHRAIKHYCPTCGARMDGEE